MSGTDPEPDPWGVAGLDLPAYLARVAVPQRAASRAALDELTEAHARTFTFDNVDVLLDQHPGVGLPELSAKFAGRGRGGYCFEHATVFAAALERLGYVVERRLGRVGAPESAARTHCVVVVDLDGQRLLADPGFGMSLLRPIPLEDGAQDDHGGWTYRLRRVPIGPRATATGWALHRRRDGGWELMHTHDELPVNPVDYATGNHFTSTYPASHFRHSLMLTRHGQGRHTSLGVQTVDGVVSGSLTVRRPGAATEHRKVALDELPALLATLAPELTADEVTRLVRRVGDFGGG